MNSSFKNKYSKILDELHEVEEQLAEMVSNESTVLESQELPKEEQKEFDEYSVELMLEEIEQAKTPEEIEEIIAKYEELLEEWGDKANLLRNDKNLKKFLAMNMAIALLQKMMLSQEMVFGKKLVENLQTSMKQQAPHVNEPLVKPVPIKTIVKQEVVPLFKRIMSDIAETFKLTNNVIGKRDVVNTPPANDKRPIVTQNQVTAKQEPIKETLKQTAQKLVSEKIETTKSDVKQEQLKTNERVNPQTQKKDLPINKAIIPPTTPSKIGFASASASTLNEISKGGGCVCGPGSLADAVTQSKANPSVNAR